MDFKFKKGAEVSTDDFWYDLTSGGYIKPENLLDDPEQAKAVKDAIDLLQSFHDTMEDKGILEYR